jgi:hypothetical protein
VINLRLLLALGVGLALAGPTGPAAGQGAGIRTGGIGVDPGFKRGVPQRVNRREAVRIARSLGMREVNVVRRTGRRWRLHGIDRRGRGMRVVISTVTGEVLKLTRT